MQAARVSDRIWSALARLRRDGPDNAAPPRILPADERAAWDLYSPVAGATARPGFVLGQVGQSLDGRIATPSGDATDVSGRDGLAHLHRCRALVDAVVVGVRTALADDPQLTVRLVPGAHPARVVLDARGRLPNTARVLRADGARRLIVQACGKARPPGVEVVELSATGGWIAPADIRAALAERGLTRLLVEGGGITLAGFLDAGLLDRLHVAVAPIIIGAGPSGLSTAPVARLADALRPETRVYGLGTDVVFDCDLAGGRASRSTWPTTQVAPATIAQRA